MSEFTKYLEKVVSNSNLSKDEIKRVMQIASLGGAFPSEIASIFIALKMKGETPEEVAGALSFMESNGRSISGCNEGVLISISSRADIFVLFSILASFFGKNIALKVPKSRAPFLKEEFSVNIKLSEETIANEITNLGLAICMNPSTRIFKQLIPIKEDIKIETLIDTLELIYSPIPSERRIIELPATNYRKLSHEALMDITEHSLLLEKIDQDHMSTLYARKKFSLNAQNITEHHIKLLLSGVIIEEVSDLLNFYAMLMNELGLFSRLSDAMKFIEDLIEKREVYKKWQRLIEISNSN